MIPGTGCAIALWHWFGFDVMVGVYSLIVMGFLLRAIIKRDEHVEGDTVVGVIVGFMAGWHLGPALRAWTAAEL